MARQSRKNTQSPSWLLSLGIILLIVMGLYLLWQYRNQTPTAPTKGLALSTTLPQHYREVLPHAPANWQVVHHTGYSLAYNEDTEQAAWVAYLLTDSMVLFGNANRRDNFRADTSIITGSASLQDYRGSGYSRGHLAPAADMKWSTTAMAESFYLSNMSPQLQTFNGGIWKSLEDRVRKWAVSEERILVVTGPVFKNPTTTIGPNNVVVPDYFYKVVLDVSPPEYKGIGFIMKHEKGRGEVYEYAVTIDSVERFTGLDFFKDLPDSTEELLERTLDLGAWEF